MTEADELLLAQRTRAIRILAIALVAGAVVTAGTMIALYVLAFDGKPIVANGIPLITLVGIAVAVPSLLLSMVLPGRVCEANVARLRAEKKVSVANLIAAYTASLIVGLALAEASAMMGSVFFLIEGHWLSMLMVGLGVLAMIWKVPNDSAVRDWVSEQESGNGERGT